MEKKNIEIKNCKIKNFQYGIKTEYYYKKDRNRNTINYYPTNVNLHGNYFENNKYGIYLIDARDFIIQNNEFRDSEAGLYVSEGSRGDTWDNIFYEKGIHNTGTKGKSFCVNRTANLYYDGAIGPNCNCHKLVNGQVVNSKINVCKDKYYLPNGIYLKGNSHINCNGSVIEGGGSREGIKISGYDNNVISNCVIKNFETGIKIIERTYYTSGTLGYAYKNYDYSSRNEAINNTIYGVDNGIKVTSKSRIEHVHNNTIIARKKNILNTNNYVINATQNYWGTTNETSIRKKFYSPSKVYYNPYLHGPNNIDLYFQKNDVLISKEGNHSKISFNIMNANNSYIWNLNLLFLEKNNDTIVNKKNLLIPIIAHDEKNMNFKVNNLSPNSEISIIIDPYNELDEKNKANNIIKSKIKYDRYLLNLNLVPKYLESIIKDYFYSHLGEIHFTDNISKANFIINVDYNDSKDLPSDFLFYSIKKNLSNIELNAQNLPSILGALDKFLSLKNNILLKDNFYEEYLNENNVKQYNYYLDILQINKTKKDNVLFAEILKSILNKIFYQREDLFINIEGIKYRIRHYFPRNEYELEKKVPILIAGGLWSDINSWKTLSRELANGGNDVYLLELTGGQGSESNQSPNYEYSFLTEKVLPGYVNHIKNLTGYNSMFYIGHSNGARTAVDFINNLDISPLKHIILLGVPGAFEDSNFFSELVKYSGKPTIDYFESRNIFHIGFEELVLKMLIPFYDANIFSLNRRNMFYDLIKDSDGLKKISLNLFKKYYYWISSDEDKQPGKGVFVDNLLLIYGNDGFLFDEESDLIVSVNDQLEIFNNIDAKNKVIKKYKVIHTGMNENEEIIDYISNYVKKILMED
jgi:parallel beta-helix repeat protein